MTIPKIIIQTWKNKELPKKAEILVYKLKLNNPNFKYLFFSDLDIFNFFTQEYPEYIKTFNNFEYNIQKIDFFRLVVIYHYGGFYFDIDMDIDSNLDELCEYNCVFPQELVKNGDPYLQKKNMFSLIGNYGFGACPKNKFIKFCIDNIIKRKIPIDDIIGKGQNYNKNVLYTTGPVLITDCYTDYKYKEEIEIIKQQDNLPNCFGNFGIHRMFGMW